MWHSKLRANEVLVYACLKRMEAVFTGFLNYVSFRSLCKLMSKVLPKETIYRMRL